MSFQIGRRPLVVLSAAVIAAALMPSLGHAQDNWPSRPVTIVVPYGPGAANDINARLLADLLSKKFGQPFVIDNRPGAGSFIGVNYTSKAKPDGYTLVENNPAMTQLGLGKGTFDPVRSLTAIGMIANYPNALVVPTSLNINSVPELVTWAKSHPDDTYFGTASYGGSQHLEHEKFAQMTGIKVKPIVIASGADIINDLVAARLKMLFSSVTSAAGPLKAGQLKLLAYTSTPGGTTVPKAPTMKELGFDYETSQWFGIWGPPGMPKPIVDKLNAAMREVVQGPEFAKLMENGGGVPGTMTADQFAEFVKSTTENLKVLSDKSGIKPE